MARKRGERRMEGSLWRREEEEEEMRGKDFGWVLKNT